MKLPCNYYGSLIFHNDLETQIAQIRVTRTDKGAISYYVSYYVYVNLEVLLLSSNRNSYESITDFGTQKVQ